MGNHSCKHSLRILLGIFIDCKISLSQLLAHFLLHSQLLAHFLILSQLFIILSHSLSGFDTISQVLAHLLNSFHYFSGFGTLSELLAYFLNF